MQSHNPNTGPSHTAVIWFLWCAADSAYAFGQLAFIDYSDSTPDVAFTYDGQLQQKAGQKVMG